MRVATVIFAVSAAVVGSGLSSSWPQVRALSASQVFSEPGKARLDLTVDDLQGKPQYKLSCRSGDLEDSDDFNFSGLFHCQLKSTYSNDSLPSLLIDNEHATADWEGRARFLLNEVVGSCARSPDWGATRTFRLREMRIELSVRDVRLSGSPSDPKIEKFTFAYSVSPDRSATTAIAEKSKLPEPRWFNRDDSSCVKEAMRGP